jgi:hypothetical protein
MDKCHAFFKLLIVRVDTSSTRSSSSASALEKSRAMEAHAAMSTTDQMTDFEVDDLDSEPRLTLDLGLREAEALRNWLLKPASDGTTALDDPLVNTVLVELGRAVDAVQATVNVRRELEQAGLNVAHLNDDQVRDLGRRVSEAALPSVRS